MTGKTNPHWRIEIQRLFEKKLAKLPDLTANRFYQHWKSWNRLPSPWPNP